jgi:hypothetical protein
MTYAEKQKERAIKLRDGLFGDPGGGVFHIKDRRSGEIIAFNLPVVLSNYKLNLWEHIRDDAVDYFSKYDIDWHKDIGNEPQEGPEGHLLSSNIACINHLFLLRQSPDLAALVLRNIDNRITNAEIVDDGYIEFEKMGGKDDNPLKEKSPQRKRGSKSTSVDALMVGKKHDGKNILILIEWKYTETYPNQKCKFIAKNDYHKNYLDLLQDTDCPVKSPKDIMKLFFDPYFQLMRQTLLGWKMVKLSEYNCDEYIHLHIVPHGNTELRKDCAVWKTLLKEPEKYRIIAPDELLNPLTNEKNTEELLKYLKLRYW